jgi:3-hydroxyacyl-[acyl-carrier-protein] dehydratase
MRAAPFHARWQAGPALDGGFAARLPLDDERWFAGHYPGVPVLPGTFLVEALVQHACVALGGDLQLAEIVGCRFHSPLLPGDQIDATFTCQATAGDATRVEAKARCRDQLAAEATLLVAPASAWPSAPVSSAASPAGRSLDLAFIRRALPHRPPALLVDSALVLDTPEARSTLFARKTILAHETGGAGGGYPDMLVVESFCQSCGLLRAATTPASDARDETKVPVVAKLAGLRLLGEAAAGDLLEHHVKMVVRTAEGAVFSGHTAVAGRVVLQVDRVVAALATVGRRDACDARDTLDS